ncbi:helix-turn-helix domain-containing protein [uncultured Nostoc sp.]|uniref:helix-turn-helix domain-containing protein n=1 Tax=uncultured Nostoc sp. TaxID=340711 RepID=UPI0035C9F31F
MSVLVKLKSAREAKGFSQNELARKTGYSLQNIQKIEQGRAASITFDALGRFCKALSCQPGDILEYTSDDEPILDAIAANQMPETEEVPKANKRSRKQEKAVGHLLLFRSRSA